MSQVKNKEEKKVSFQEGMKNYFKGVKAEWGKISWPQRQQIMVETGIVIVVVAIFTFAVYLLDIIFQGILGLIK